MSVSYRLADVLQAREKSPARLSRELRLGTSPALSRRRWIVGLAFFGMAMGKIVSLYQMGILRHLPDLPGRLFNAEKVDASNYAYKRLQTPDGFLMVITYAITAALAAAGGRDRATSHPVLPVLMAAKAGYDVATTAKLSREEWQENRALCGYCTAAALASLVILKLSLPEAARAAERLAGRR
jgi:uncharacterized membrane protein